MTCNRQSVTGPLLADLEGALQQAQTTVRTPATTPAQQVEVVTCVLRIHHLVRALGSLVRGFPDAPVPTPQEYAGLPWVRVFAQVAEATLVSLDAMNGYKVVREAVSLLDLFHPHPSRCRVPPVD